MSPEGVLAGLRRANRAVAVLVGLLLLATAGFVLADILLRQIGAGLGGTDEISGYAMAVATSWGMGYALLELGHVRIDALRARGGPRVRALFDLLALGALAGTVTAVAWKAWPVLSKSLANGSRANTPLETPLALVQAPWLAGWAWFAAMAWITLACAVVLVLRGAPTEAHVGVRAEAET